MAEFVGAVDQGTTSTKFIIFDRRGRIKGRAGREHRQIYPRPGWVEHDPLEIWTNTQKVMETALARAGLSGHDLAAIGVANQRETVVAWDRLTGRPLAPAIVWQDTRTRELCQELIKEGGLDRFRARTGLPMATYFSGPKIRWLLDNAPEVKEAFKAGRALTGTVESWLIWRLTGGPEGGAHVTDATNASRTMLMNLHDLAWDKELLEALDIPKEILPRIVPSSDSRTWGKTRPDGPLKARVPVCGALGDQQAALVGQACFSPGQAKNTYGTGCFLLLNTGREPVPSQHGLLTTVAYRLDNEPPVFCLEGSIAVAGALVQWLRDNLGLISQAQEIEALAGQVPDSGGVYFVPAFSGLFAPRWRSDARGVIVGLTGFADRSHLARAVLEATAYQTRDLVETMNQDSGLPLSSLKVDGGMVENELLMQFQADQLQVPIVRPAVSETTALGAAYAAGLGVGFWSDLKALTDNWRAERTWRPAMGREERDRGYQGWLKAVERTLNWVE